jgi:hypothetical protein
MGDGMRGRVVWGNFLICLIWYLCNLVNSAVQGRINHCAICAMAWGPPVQGAPRDAKKIWTAHGSGPGIYLPPFWGGKQKKKKGRHPQSFAYTPIQKSWKRPWSGPPRSFGMGPPNVLIRACCSVR